MRKYFPLDAGISNSSSRIVIMETGSVRLATGPSALSAHACTRERAAIQRRDAVRGAVEALCGGTWMLSYGLRVVLPSQNNARQWGRQGFWYDRHEMPLKRRSRRPFSFVVGKTKILSHFEEILHCIINTIPRLI